MTWFVDLLSKFHHYSRVRDDVVEIKVGDSEHTWGQEPVVFIKLQFFFSPSLRYSELVGLDLRKETQHPMGRGNSAHSFCRLLRHSTASFT